MTNAAERIARVRLKIGHALDLRRRFESEAQAFFATRPFAVATKRVPETDRLRYYVSAVQPVPWIFSLLAGDMLHNLRGALDNLAYQLFLVGTDGTQGDGTHIYFPICADAETYEREKGRRTKGIRAEAVAAIDALKPYKGGNDPLWLLHRLNVIDKFRVVGVRFAPSLNDAPD